MVPMKESLADLSELREKLNAETDGLNEIFAKIEEQLDGIGVSYWDRELLDPEVQQAYRETDQKAGIRRGWVVGYTKIGNGWGFAAKQVIEVTEGADGWTSDPLTEIEDMPGSDVPLAHAPRLIRAEAAGRIEPILDGVKRRAAWMVESIENAKSLVEK